MRIEILMSPKELKFTIPINYNELIHNSFNKIFSNGYGNFSGWMIDDTTRHKIEEKTKLFTFSKLLNYRAKVMDFSLIGFGDTRLIFSAPIEDDVAHLFLESLRKSMGLKMLTPDSTLEFLFKKLTQVPEPDFEEVEKYIMLSPTTISKTNFSNSHRSLHFMRVNESDTEGAIAYNLRKKYSVIHNKNYSGPMEIKLDRDYIDSKGGSEGVSKLITIREGMANEFRIKAFLAPITIKASPEMQKIAYQCGIGEKNSLGMGMLEVAKKPKTKYFKPYLFKKAHNNAVTTEV